MSVFEMTGVESTNVTVPSTEMRALISSDSIYGCESSQHGGSGWKKASTTHTMLTRIVRTSSSVSIALSRAMSRKPRVMYVRVSLRISQRGARSIAC